MEISSQKQIYTLKPSSSEALMRFKLIFKAVQQHSQWIESSCGVTSAQLWMLWVVAKNPGLNVKELANTLAIHHSTASSLLDKLAKKALIKRERISRDQRVVTIILTEKGHELIAEAPSHPQGILQHALLALPDDVLDAITKNLDLLIEKMQIKDEAASMQALKSDTLIQNHN